jgi:hypothetical protein
VPLNISIDVDGTLLEANGQPAHNVREKLLRLKSQAHRVQLWSTGGAEYAQKMAMKYKLDGLFDGYATKPDVAIDDIPDSARPVATIRVDNHFLLDDAIEIFESKVKGCVESALCPSQSLKQLVVKMQEDADEARARLGNLLVGGIPLHPVPFFGNIESARVITIGLNPAITEFAGHRGWNSSLGAEDLTFRLVNYFRLAGVHYPPPHCWFCEILEFLHVIRCPHKIAAAHVDMCPWTSKAPFRLIDPVRTQFWDFIDEQMKRWLPKILAHARGTVKLIVILESPNPSSLEKQRQGRTQKIIRGCLGAWGGEIYVKKKEELIEWAWNNKEALRNVAGFSRVVD